MLFGTCTLSHCPVEVRTCFPITIGVRIGFARVLFFPVSRVPVKPIYVRAAIFIIWPVGHDRAVLTLLLYTVTPRRGARPTPAGRDKEERTRLRDVMAIFRIPFLNNFCRFDSKSYASKSYAVTGGSRCICRRHEKIFSTRSRVLINVLRRHSTDSTSDFSFTKRQNIMVILRGAG